MLARLLTFRQTIGNGGTQSHGTKRYTLLGENTKPIHLPGFPKSQRLFGKEETQRSGRIFLRSAKMKLSEVCGDETYACQAANFSKLLEMIGRKAMGAKALKVLCQPGCEQANRRKRRDAKLWELRYEVRFIPNGILC